MWYFLYLYAVAIILPANVISLTTHNTIWPEYHKFYTIPKSGTVFFDLWAGHDAWIAIFAEPYPTAPKFEILLGASGALALNKVLKNRRTELASRGLEVLNYYDYKRFWMGVSYQDENNSSFAYGVAFNRDDFFLKAIVQEKFDFKYFALATTGADNNGYWKLLDIDEKEYIEIKTWSSKTPSINAERIMIFLWNRGQGVVKPKAWWQKHQLIVKIANNEGFRTGSSPGLSVTTPSPIGQPIYEKFYSFVEGVLRFRVKAEHWAWLRFTTTRSSYPNYEITLGASDNTVVAVYKSRDQLHTYYGSVLNKNEYRGFWIDFTTTSDYYGYTNLVICVGKEGSQEHFIRYVDKRPTFNVNYFSIATTSNKKGDYGYWELEDIWYDKG